MTLKSSDASTSATCSYGHSSLKLLMSNVLLADPNGSSVQSSRAHSPTALALQPHIVPCLLSEGLVPILSL